jgi:hypothetical protein
MTELISISKSEYDNLLSAELYRKNFRRKIANNVNKLYH